MRPVLIRGKVVQAKDNTFSVIFLQSNLFWDETDIGDLGKEILLTNVASSEEFKEGDVIIAEGKTTQKGRIEASKVYPSYFQPLGVDWKISARTGIILALIIFAVLIYKKLQKRIH